MDVKAIINQSFGWSNNEHSEKPKLAFARIKGSPEVIPALQEIIKERELQGDHLRVFHWWMGVTLDVIPSQLK